ncbi:MAG: hypothetical protein ACRC36_00175 [Lacrimispora sphenoides]
MERVLVFNYPFEFTDKVKQLKNILKQNNVEFICNESNGYYPYSFIVRKSGRRWNELYKMINSVRAAKYDFRKAELDQIDGNLIEIIRV